MLFFPIFNSTDAKNVHVLNWLYSPQNNSHYSGKVFTVPVCHDTVLMHIVVSRTWESTASCQFSSIASWCSTVITGQAAEEYWFSLKKWILCSQQKVFHYSVFLKIFLCTSQAWLVWRRPPLRIKSEGLVKYRYLTISKGIRLDSIHNAGYVRYCSPIQTKALCCLGDCL